VTAEPTNKKRLAVELLTAALVYFAAAAAMSWPAVAHLDEVIIGGGELGGWLWRHWWHFTELEALLSGGVGFADGVIALLSLGRYPETGNIVDVLMFAWPLQSLLGLPLGYNLEIFGILIINGLCGYALARSLVKDPVIALAAGLLAVVNPVAIQDIQFSGLRQVIFWWLLLLPIPLAKALRDRDRRAAAVAGALLGLTSAFYWFYGLFAAVAVALWCGVSWWRRPEPRAPWREELRWTLDFGLFTLLVALPFATPYLLGIIQPQSGVTSALPEMTFFEAFPTYEAIRDVPLRPATAEENLLSSLNRGIVSSWSPDYLFNPAHGRGLPLAVLILGLLPLASRKLRDKRALAWAVVFGFFYLGTLGPFLKDFGARVDTAEVYLAGGEAVRLPWTWMFRWIPGMSRMFAPYRMGAMVAVSAVALVALGLGRIPGRPAIRRAVAGLAMLATMLQVSLHRPADGAGDGEAAELQFSPPLAVAPLFVPDFYASLAADAEAGIIELPLEQQQDLLYYYQRHHQRKVFRGWATDGAVPPALRAGGGGDSGALLRYLATPDDQRATAAALYRFSSEPDEASLAALTDADLDQLLAVANYRHIVVHERGYYLVDPQRGAALYERAVARMGAFLGADAEEAIEFEATDYPGNALGHPTSRVHWSSQKVSLHDGALPGRYRMAVFDVGQRADDYEGPSLQPSHSAHGASPDILLVVLPGLRADGLDEGAEAAFIEGFERTPDLRFRQAYSQSVSPFVSLGSMLAGRYPASIPLCGLSGGDAMSLGGGSTSWCNSIPEADYTLPKVLEAYGYRTGAIVADTEGVTLEEDAGALESWRYLQTEVTGWWRRSAGQPRFAMVVAPDLHLLQYGGRYRRHVVEEGSPEEAAMREELSELYQDLARLTGVELARTVAALEATPPAHPLWVVVTSTNGMNLAEASGVHSDHLQSLTSAILVDRTLRVPLLFYSPESPRATTERQQVVELLDLFPTLIALGGARPLADLPGEDLRSSSLEAREGGAAYAEFGDMLALREDDHLLTFRFFMHNTSSLDASITDGLLKEQVQGSQFYMLHDVTADPMQETDRVSEELARAEAMRQRLIALRTGEAAPADVLTPERLNALRLSPAQGYW